MTDINQAERARALDEFTSTNNNSPGGNALVRSTTALAERTIGAQPVAVYRDEARVFQKLSELAARAGDDWFYRFPVRNRDGGSDHIDGPTIKLANDVARIFGNCSVEIREMDVGDAWVFYARFCDIETGFSMERAYRQRKSQGSMKTKDAERQLDLAYQIGQSKAIRNVVVNSLQIYADHALSEAKNSLVEKIGRSLDSWRDRTVARIHAKLGIDITRVERKVGRATKDWLAPDIAQVIAMCEAIADGMATVDEQFPEVGVPDARASAGAADMAGGRGSTADARPSSHQPAKDGGAMETTEAKQEAADKPHEMK